MLSSTTVKVFKICDHRCCTSWLEALICMLLLSSLSLTLGASKGAKWPPPCSFILDFVPSSSGTTISISVSFDSTLVSLLLILLLSCLFCNFVWTSFLKKKVNKQLTVTIWWKLQIHVNMHVHCIMKYNPNKHDDFHLKTTNKLFQHVDKVFSVIQWIFNVDRAGWQNFKKIKVFVHCLQKYKLHKL